MKKSKKILIIIGVVLGIVCGMMASDLKGDIFPKSESSMDVNIGIALNVLNDTETGSYKKKNIMYTSLNGKTCYDILEQGELEMTITDKK